MKAIIMAGGFGTRLRPLTCQIPKPMVPMVNRPMMEHIIMLLKEHQITEMVALLFHQAESISDYFGDGSDFGVKIDYIRPDADYGTAGAVGMARELLKEPFIVISGDLLTDFDLGGIIAFHNKKKALATITLTRVANPLEYGIVITDQDDRISRFLEKPTWGQVFSDTINTGIYVFQPEVFDLIPVKKEFDFSQDLFPLILSQNKPLYGCITNGYWRDIGNITEYRQAHLDALKGEVRVDIEGDRLNLIGKDIWVGKGSSINAKNSRLTGAVIMGRNVTVGQGTHLHDVVVGNDCHIGQDAFVEHSIIWSGCRIGDQARVEEAIVCEGVEIGSQAVIEQHAILSSQVKIGSQARVSANVKVWPGKSVDDQAVLTSSLIWGDRWFKEFFAGPRVTGLANMEMTPEFAAKLGAAYGALLGKGSVVLTSRDSHPVSRMINRAVISGLLSAGVKVHELRALPIPIVRYQLKTGGDQGGLHTRKSPFDPKMVDIIFFDKDGKDLPAGKIKNLERMFLREDFSRAQPEDTGVIEFPHRVMEGYREGLLSHIDTQAIREAKYKVVIDYAYGAAAGIFPSILGELGIEVVALNAFENPEKLTKSGDDFVAAQQRLSQMVQSIKADVGFLLDSGAERVFLVDEQGKIMDEDQALAAVCLLVMKGRKVKELAVPVTASRAIEEMARKYQVRVKRSRIDNRSLIEEAAGENVAFVASRRGGYIFPEFQPAFDAMLSITKILELMALTGSKLGSITSEIPPSHMVKKNIPCPWSKKGLVLRTLMEQTKDHPEKQFIDGIKLFYGRDWVQVLPDPNRELFHINAEADDQNRAQELVNEYTRKIEECLK
ncbi:MAG: mannose-1-phosphate guanyltransferase [Candidatus Edwardsbacteria bacterium]|nr:mannose-1-phosphate guanyltransferase [Candidatus Edwardsbacteria bacterium]